MLAASVTDTLWIVAAVTLIGGLFWLSRRIDPHWVAKDGRAFTCRIQPLHTDGRVEGRWREARGVVDGDHVRLVVRGIGSSMKQPYESHPVVGRSESPPARSAVFLLGGTPMWALRVPATSRAVAVLEDLRQRA